MQFERLAIADLILCVPKIFGDDRGFFYESFNQNLFDAAVGHQVRFVQDNHSRSAKGVLRGLHYQIAPRKQGKLVRVTRGALFDVAVDIRRRSPTFGKWVGTELSETNHKQLWIPPGFAHGFFSLIDGTEMLYKATEFYDPGLERVIRWDDPTLGIDWPLTGKPVLSAKDQSATTLEHATPID